MSGETTIAVADIFVALLVALALVAAFSRRFAVPYTVALVVFGLLVTVLAPRVRIEVTRELVLAILVPGLVFEAALRMDVAQLRRNLPAVTLLAVPGVLIVAVLTGFLLSAMTSMSYGAAFLVGAVTSATDPVAVIATMSRVRAPERLANLVEAESLFNDGTGVVLFGVDISGVALIPNGLNSMLVTLIVSIGLGAVVGVGAAWLASRTEDVNLELTLTLISAYGTYLLADRIHQSGIIATVVAGVILGSYGRRVGISARGRVAMDTVWSYLAFLLTALVFLLVGLTITPSGLVGAAGVVAWAVVAVLVGRAAVVYGLLGGLGATRQGPGWASVCRWAGCTSCSSPGCAARSQSPWRCRSRRLTPSTS